MPPALHRRRYLRAMGAGLGAVTSVGTVSSRSATEPGVAWESRPGGAESTFFSAARPAADEFVLAGTRWVDDGEPTTDRQAPTVISLDSNGFTNWQWTRDLDAGQVGTDVTATSTGDLLVGGFKDSLDGPRQRVVTLDRISSSGYHSWYAAVTTDWMLFRVRVAEFVGSHRFAVATAGANGANSFAGDLWAITEYGDWQWREEFGAASPRPLAVLSADERVAVFGTGDRDCEYEWHDSVEADGTKRRLRCGGDFTDVVARAADGYVFGFVDDDRPGLRKVDAAGRERWSRTFDHHQEMVRPADVIETADGGYVLLAEIYRTRDREKLVSLVVKTDPSGNREWVKYLDADGRHVAGRALLPAGPGRMLVGGMTGADTRRAWAAMLDESADAELDPTTSTATPSEAPTTPGETPTATPTTSPTQSATATEEESSPGFGLAAGVGGLTAAAALRRRSGSD